MGTLLDTSVLVRLERLLLDAQDSREADAVWQRFETSLPAGSEAAVASVTASELLHGVHRKSGARQARRAAFVESVLLNLPVLPFDLRVARVHASLWAELAGAGLQVGAHDLLIAATAICHGWAVATFNEREFARVPGLAVVVPELGAADGAA